MKKRGKGKGKKVGILEDVNVDGACDKWEKSTKKFFGVFSPFDENDKVATGNAFEWYTSEAETGILAILTEEFAGYQETHVMTCSECTCESRHEQTNNTMVLNCYGGLDQSFKYCRKSDKGKGRNYSYEEVFTRMLW